MLRLSVFLAVLLSLAFLRPARAADWTYDAQGAEATELTGGYGAVGNAAGTSVYNDGVGDYSYPVILDSGSSGFLMSQYVTDSFGVPLQAGQTYTEVGIGGNELENVTQPLTAYYGPASDPNPDDSSTMTNLGTFSFESRQSDPYFGLVFFDVVGTPAFQNSVLSVTPSQSYNIVQDTLGFLTAQTTIQNTAPALPKTGTYHVPVTWTNFITGPTVPTEGLNPVINATAKGPGGATASTGWLFDSGAQFTTISPAFATQLGINLANPIAVVEGSGVGNSIVDFDEYQISQIALPLSTGDRLVFNNPYVFVPTGTTLPAGLTAVLGENLFMQSTPSIDPETGEPDGTFAPLFSQWYLDGPNSELVLYDPSSTYAVPEPAALALFSLGSLLLLRRRNRARR